MTLKKFNIKKLDYYILSILIQDTDVNNLANCDDILARICSVDYEFAEEFMSQYSSRETINDKIKNSIKDLIDCGYVIKKPNPLGEYYYFEGHEEDLVDYKYRDKFFISTYIALKEASFLDFAKKDTYFSFIEQQIGFFAKRPHYTSINLYNDRNDENLLSNLSFISKKVHDKKNLKFEYEGITVKVSPYEIIEYKRNYYLIGRAITGSSTKTKLSHYNLKYMFNVSDVHRSIYLSIEEMLPYYPDVDSYKSDNRIFRFHNFSNTEDFPDETAYTKYAILYQYVKSRIITDLTESIEFIVDNDSITSEEIKSKFGESCKESIQNIQKIYRIVNYSINDFIEWAIPKYHLITVLNDSINSEIKKTITRANLKTNSTDELKEINIEILNKSIIIDIEENLGVIVDKDTRYKTQILQTYLPIEKVVDYILLNYDKVRLSIDNDLSFDAKESYTDIAQEMLENRIAMLK